MSIDGVRDLWIKVYFVVRVLEKRWRKLLKPKSIRTAKPAAGPAASKCQWPRQPTRLTILHANVYPCQKPVVEGHRPPIARENTTRRRGLLIEQTAITFLSNLSAHVYGFVIVIFKYFILVGLIYFFVSFPVNNSSEICHQTAISVVSKLVYF